MIDPSRLRDVRLGLVLALCTILFGFGLGGVFGAAEDQLKDALAASGQAALDTAYAGDEAKMKSVVDKSWTYFKRAHLHGGGIGAASLAGILLLSSLRTPGAGLKRALAGGLGLGGLGYATYWLLAGWIAPGMGSTGAAKDSLGWLAIPSAGLLLLGFVVLTALTVRELYAAKDA